MLVFAAAAAAGPDLAFVGTVHTMDPALGTVEALAVDDGRIVFAGTREGLRALGRPARIVRIGRGALVPGWVDGHAHPAEGGLGGSAADLSQVDTLERLLARVARHARRHPERAWVTGSGWDLPTFLGRLSLARLDTAVPDRPAFLLAADGHSAWVNSRALALAGIPAPEAPEGLVREAQVDRVAALLPDPTDAEADEAVARYLALARRHGITTVVDANAAAWALRAYRRADDAGRLTVRVHAAVEAAGPVDVAQAVELRDATAGGRLRVDAIKAYVDGVLETGTAALLAPYADGATVGPLLDAAALEALIRAADAAGLRLHAHAIGDAAVRAALDATAAARPERPVVLAHLELVDPADVPRFAELGVTACVQALWAWPDPWITELTVPKLDPERAARLYPFGALARAGATLAGGSDWDVTSMDVLDAVEVAVLRQDPRRPGPALAPDQAVDVPTMLRAYTADGARALGRDDLGRLAPGSLADLALLARDPLAIPPASLSAARVRAVWIEGERVRRIAR